MSAPAPGRVRRVNNTAMACGRLHFRRLLFPWTDSGLGNCNYLDTCRHMHNCKFVHYELDGATGAAAGRNGKGAATRPSLRDGPPVPSYLQARALPAVADRGTSTAKRKRLFRLRQKPLGWTELSCAGPAHTSLSVRQRIERSRRVWILPCEFVYSEAKVMPATSACYFVNLVRAFSVEAGGVLLGWAGWHRRSQCI